MPRCGPRWSGAEAHGPERREVTQAAWRIRKPGRPIAFDEIELWPESVKGAELLTDISGASGSYIIMDERQRNAVALWAAHAHAHDLRDTSPPLVIKSPAMRSGKTKLVEVLEVE
jgi:hypothetical protein